MNPRESRRNSLRAVVNDVQSYVTASNPGAFMKKEIDSEGIMNDIEKYITDKKLYVEGFKGGELVRRIYQEMVEYSILTDFLSMNNVEEINVNSWEDIKVRYSDGRIITLEDTFLSAGNAQDIMKKLLSQESEKLIDVTEPIVRGHLRNNIRITTSISPIIDEERGAMASIRIINPRKLSKDDFINSNTLTRDMFDLLSLLYFNGSSMCITGETGSGKTTLMSVILNELPSDLRLITIEEDTREFDLIKKNDDGYIEKEVIHWKTHGKFNQEKLLEFALTCDPDQLCLAEMKGREAYSAQEASRTGHAVITTTHAKSCRATYRRMVTLCKLTSDMDYQILNELVTEAFPIVCFAKKMKDNTRKITEITECIQKGNGEIEIQTLYEYVINHSERDENGQLRIHGEFIKRNNISNSLQQQLLGNGVTSSELAKYITPTQINQTVRSESA